MKASRKHMILEWLADFEKLERKDTDRIGWIALKLSIDRDRAEAVILSATATDPHHPGCSCEQCVI